MAEDNVSGAENGETPQDSPESTTVLAEEIETIPGNAPDEALEKLRPVLSLAEQTYSQVLALIKEMKAAETVLQKFHAREAGVTTENVESAKTQFHQAKKSYLQLGNQINEGIKQVHTLAKTFPDDVLIQDQYRVYLAKLLASLETHNPIQPLVELFAASGFDLTRQEFAVAEEDAQRGATPESLEKKRLEEIQLAVTRLEVRYQKRQIANAMRQGTSRAVTINSLSRLVSRDPEDVNTYIWLANLLNAELKKERDQNKRMSLRDGILDYCKRGFAVIDDYLNLQGIESLNARDRMRAEYVKTITSIRKPLLEQGA